MKGTVRSTRTYYNTDYVPSKDGANSFLTQCAIRYVGSPDGEVTRHFAKAGLPFTIEHGNGLDRSLQNRNGTSLGL